MTVSATSIAAPKMTSAGKIHLTAAGFLALLDEPQPETILHALQGLLATVDTFWPEIADHITKMYKVHLTSLAKSSTSTSRPTFIWLLYSLQK